MAAGFAWPSSTALGVTTPNFALTLFVLGHKDIDGLVGMKFSDTSTSTSGRPIDRSSSDTSTSKSDRPINRSSSRWSNDERCQWRRSQDAGRGLRDHRLDLGVAGTTSGRHPLSATRPITPANDGARKGSCRHENHCCAYKAEIVELFQDLGSCL
jgi:hypothetical protein